jgi:hypothetical protein
MDWIMQKQFMLLFVKAQNIQYFHLSLLGNLCSFKHLLHISYDKSLEKIILWENINY